MNLQYWYFIDSALSLQDCFDGCRVDNCSHRAYIRKNVVHFEGLTSRLFNADLLKIPFFIWFSNPATMGYRMFYDLLQSKVISPYSESVEEMMSKVSMEVNKYVKLVLDRIQRKQVEKKE